MVYLWCWITSHGAILMGKNSFHWHRRPVFIGWRVCVSKMSAFGGSVQIIIFIAQKTKTPENQTPEKKQNPLKKNQPLKKNKIQKTKRGRKTKTSNIYNFEYDIVSRSHMHVKDRKNQPIFICDSGKLHQLKYIHSTCFILFGIYILLFGILLPWKT